MSVEHYSKLSVFVVCTSTKKEVEIVTKSKTKYTCPKCEPVGNNRNGKFCSLCGTENVIKAAVEKIHKKVDWSPSIQDASDAMELLGERLIFPACAAYEHFEDYGEIIFEANQNKWDLTHEGMVLQPITSQMIVEKLNEFTAEYATEISKLIEMFGWGNVQVKFGLFNSYS